PHVALVAAGPIPDPVKGELACAYVVRASGSSLTEQELLDYSRDRLAAYKRPRTVKFVESLPTTSSGKIMRRRLIEEFPS
ncbi:MAG: fatty-acid--CoA ligase, partial [Rhodococcus sp. (in: high G+C Gram-positive bacteria)]